MDEDILKLSFITKETYTVCYQLTACTNKKLKYMYIKQYFVSFFKYITGYNL